MLPATAEPVCLVGEADGELVYGETAIGANARVRDLRFVLDARRSPGGGRGDRAGRPCLLAPGSLLTSVLATSALPTVAAALVRTSAPVVWISNLEPDAIETAGMAGEDHLAALRRHGVRVDAALPTRAPSLRSTANGSRMNVFGRCLGRC